MSDFFINKKYKPLFELLDPNKQDEYENIRYVVITGGRGSAKSVGLSCFINEATYQDHNILFTRYTMSSAEESVIPEFKEKCEWLGDLDSFQFKSDKVINLATDSRIIFKGQKPSSKTANGALKSVNNISIFVTEEAQEVVDFELWDKINKSIRTKGKKNLIILVLNPTNVHHWIYKEFFAPNAPKKAMTLYIHTTYLDNKKHLDPIFLKEAELEKDMNASRYNNTWLGKWSEDTEGALWDMKVIEANRILEEAPTYKRIIISIDPAVTSNENSDEHGLVVCGMVSRDEFHVLEDKTCKATPDQICKMAVALYHKYKADRIIGEVNNGGDWIEQLLRTVDRNVSYKAIRASRGKITRAEPIASLYEQNKVKHVGFYANLEYEMTTYTGDPREKSPNAMDALVWGLTELSVNNTSVTSREL